MKKGGDLVKRWKGFEIIHHNLPGNRQPLHAHAEHQLFLPLSGRMTFTDEMGIRYQVNRESMFFIPAGMLHSFESSSEQGERLIIMISTSVWRRLVDEPLAQMICVSVNQLVKELAFYLLINSDTKYFKSLIESMITVLSELLDAPKLLNKQYSRPRAGMDPRLIKALEFIDAQLRESFSVSDVAKSSGMSPRNFARLFQAELATSPKHFIMVKRMELAKFLLKQKGASVTDTALECGYNSLSQFIRAFQKVTGQLPSEFLK